MEKRFVIAVFLAVVAIGVGLFLNSQFNQEITNKEESSEATNGIISEARLGNLCNGEEECREFCLDNRGQCESYCRGRGDELCRIIFADNTEQQNGNNAENRGNDCVSNPNPVFTKSFTDLSKINHITPIGNVNAGSLSRSYIAVKTYSNGTGMFVSLYSPTNATLFRIAYAYRGDPALGARAEYRLDFRVSCEVTFAFDHIAEISEKLKQFAPTEPAYTTRNDKEVSVSISEGEYLGSTNGGLFGKAWDFLLFNYAKEVPHINPSRWTSEHNKYADCPYDYFTEQLKSQYYAMFTSAGGEKTSNPSCRSASRDVAGTLSGGWFKGDSTDSRGTRLVIGSDYSTVDLVIDKDDPTDSGRLLSLRHLNAPKKPEDVIVGNSVCYFDPEINKHAYLKLLTAMEMGLSIGEGNCPSSFPGQYETWVR